MGGGLSFEDKARALLKRSIADLNSIRASAQAASVTRRLDDNPRCGQRLRTLREHRRAGAIPADQADRAGCGDGRYAIGR